MNRKKSDEILERALKEAQEARIREELDSLLWYEVERERKAAEDIKIILRAFADEDADEVSDEDV